MKAWLKGGLLGAGIGLVTLFLIITPLWYFVIPRIPAGAESFYSYFAMWLLVAVWFFNPILGFIIGSITGYFYGRKKK
jgi:hypothetical protein